ncbi:hypothetical protein CcCBS67573_g10700 [Chytriomyces confervae]|uniref:Centriolar satellite-associated tubulin polyglutamylase complex regulator 1 n=1 Tax=Chytriomyces confervae TaxID=246404 RepID=A0A507CKE6_9FUNG|nr:hypothetical protein CcCBS67573_g10700 [Chytriomyces confervae]
MKPDSSATSQTQFLLDYFNAVISGTNVLHRDFAYIQSTPRNRLSFVTQFSHLLTSNRQESCKPADYFHLIELMSQGFPYEVVKRAAELTEYILGIQQQQPEKTKLGVALPSKSFVVFFRVCFYYMGLKLELVAMAEQCIVAAFEEHQRVRPQPLSPNYSHEELKTIRDSFVTLLNEDISKSSTVLRQHPGPAGTDVADEYRSSIFSGFFASDCFNGGILDVCLPRVCSQFGNAGCVGVTVFIGCK